MYQVGHKRGTKLWVIIIVTLLLLVFLYFTGIIGFIFGLFSKGTAPVQGGLYGISNIFNSFQTKKELEKNNEDLNKKLEQAALDSAQLKTLQAENQALRQQLKFFEEKHYNFVTTRVISSSAEETTSALILNRGAKDGIKVGYPVVADDGILVGKIIEVKDSISTLLLLTDSLSKVAATIQNKDTTIGVIAGEHSISIKMEMIPQNEEVKVGDTVVTSGLQENIPAGLLIGLIDRVDATSSELFKKAYIYPLVDYHKLNIVSVLVP